MERATDKDIILITGAPGNGKSHLGEALAERLNSPDRLVKHVSFGDRVRRIAGEVGSLAVTPSACTDEVITHLSNPSRRSHLLDNDTAAKITSEILAENENTDLLLIDGYPRNIDQYFDMQALMAFDHQRVLRGMLVAQTDDRTALQRLIRRNPRHLEDEVTPERARERLDSGRSALDQVMMHHFIRSRQYAEIDTSEAKSKTVALGLRAVENFYK